MPLIIEACFYIVWICFQIPNSGTINDFSTARLLLFNNPYMKVSTAWFPCKSSTFLAVPFSKGTFVRSGIRTHAGKTRLRPERSALDRSAILTRHVRFAYIDNWNGSLSFAACFKQLFPTMKLFTADIIVWCWSLSKKIFSSNYHLSLNLLLTAVTEKLLRQLSKEK